MTDNLAQQPSAPATRGLVHLPLPLFAAPMGLGGIGLAWREAAHVLGAPGVIGEALLLLTTVLWTVIFALHLPRPMRHPGALAGDFKHPIRSAFAAAVSIGLMLIAAAFLPYNRDAAATIWIASRESRGVAGSGWSMYCACPPWRCGGVTRIRASVLALSAP